MLSVSVCNAILRRETFTWDKSWMFWAEAKENTWIHQCSRLPHVKFVSWVARFPFGFLQELLIMAQRQLVGKVRRSQNFQKFEKIRISHSVLRLVAKFGGEASFGSQWWKSSYTASREVLIAILASTKYLLNWSITLN